MLIVRHPDRRAAERAYIFEVVLEHFLGLQWRGLPEARDDVEITLADDDRARALTVADVLFASPAEDWLTVRSLPSSPLAVLAADDADVAATCRIEHPLPIVYGHRSPEDGYATESPDAIRLGLDIFGSIFFLIARYEEVALSCRDSHARFPARASLAHREGFLKRPLANEYLELLWSALERLWPRLTRRRRSFRELLSHDVDSPLYSSTTPSRLIIKAAGGDLLRRHDPDLAAHTLLSLVARMRDNPKLDPYNTFETIMDHSEHCGLRSAFYFMAGATDLRFDSGYSLNDPWIARLMRRIHDRGHEIGIHPSYRSFRDPSRLEDEFAVLRRACAANGVSQAEWGGRQHFLRWENPTTWRAWEQAGLAYDSSLGFPDEPGFRSGTCYEYPAFDLVTRRRLDLRERPLIVMEMAALDAPQSSAESAASQIDELRQRCRRFDGDFTLLWHNSRLGSRRIRALYRSVVGDLTPRAETHRARRPA